MEVANSRDAASNVLFLLALFNPTELLPDWPRFSRFDSCARVLHESYKALRQFLNSRRLAPFNGLRGDKLGADADGRGSREDKIGSRLLIHTTRGDQRDLWKRRLQGFDVTVASDLRAGEDFDEVGSGAPRGEDLGGCQGAAQNRDLFLGGELDDCQIKAGTG